MTISPSRSPSPMADELMEARGETLRALKAFQGKSFQQSARLSDVAAGISARLAATSDIKERMQPQTLPCEAKIISHGVKMSLPVVVEVIHKTSHGKVATTVDLVSKAVLGGDKDVVDTAVSLSADYGLSKLMCMPLPMTLVAELGGIVAEHREKLLHSARKAPTAVTAELRRHLDCNGPTPEGASVIAQAAVGGLAAIGEVMGAVQSAAEEGLKSALTSVGNAMLKKGKP